MSWLAIPYACAVGAEALAKDMRTKAQKKKDEREFWESLFDKSGKRGKLFPIASAKSTSTNRKKK